MPPSSSRSPSPVAPSRYPFPPHPDGWFAVAVTGDVPPGRVHAVTFMGRELVLFRTRSGRLVAADAFCPHLGAHFAHGGEVRGEVLRCPFHGFRFDVDGRCVATEYGKKPPPSARLRVWPLRVRGPFILLWHAHDGRAPDWEVPALPDGDGLGDVSVHAWELRAHPQETTENSVDLGHFAAVHGYADLEVLAPAVTDGPHLHTRYAFSRRPPLAPTRARMRVVIDVNVWGLGYSLVETRVEALGVRARNWVLPVPTAADRTTLRVGLASTLDVTHAAARVAARLARPLLHALMWRGYRHDVAQDFAIWQHKAYIERPPLADGDGPIAVYRKWCQQFYGGARAD